MMPPEQADFFALVEEVFAAQGRTPSDNALKAWWIALKDRSLVDLTRVMRKMVQERGDLPTPNAVILAIRDEIKPNASALSGLRLQPNKTTLLAARRHLDMFGEIKARDAYGDEAVNILLDDPTKGYTAVDPRTYGGTLLDHIKADLQSGVRKADK